MRSIATVVVLSVIVLGGVALVRGITGRAQTIVQPIAFNHMVHLDVAGIGCVECHTDAASGRSAGLPGKNICFDCHDIDEEEDATEPNPEKAKLFAFDEMDHDIPWVRVAVTKPDVFFSHRRHVSAAKMDCLECHRDQSTLSAPPTTARLVMSMDDCIACHEQNGASNDCLACHR